MPIIHCFSCFVLVVLFPWSSKWGILDIWIRTSIIYRQYVRIIPERFSHALPIIHCFSWFVLVILFTWSSKWDVKRDNKEAALRKMIERPFILSRYMWITYSILLDSVFVCGRNFLYWIRLINLRFWYFRYSETCLRFPYQCMFIWNIFLFI